jgi:Phage major capsid protein E
MEIFDTVVLCHVVQNLKTADTWLLDTFFPGIVECDTEEVAVDVEIGVRRMAPLVSPRVQGKLVESRTVQTNLIKPAYIKDKRAPDLRRPVKRMMGERIGGVLTPAQRMQANLAYEMADQIDMIKRRKNWMAAQALRQGKINMDIEGIGAVTVDFQRDPELSIVLADGDTWAEAHVVGDTVSPADNIDQWAALVLQKSGAQVTDVVFSLSPFNAFIRDPRVRDGVYFPRSGESTIQFGGGITKGVQFKGIWGTYRLWLYNEWFIDDETGKELPMLPDGEVLLTSPDLDGVQIHGAIMDPAFAYGAMAYAPKSWLQEDPAQRMLMMQSAPIVVPTRVNACARAKVL